MRSIFKTGLRGLLAGACFMLGLGVIGASASISLFTGPSGTNPMIRPDIMGDMNTLINNINAGIGLNTNSTANNGELQITAANAFAANGTVNTGLTAVGPVGSHTTVQKWLVVVDGGGTMLFAPLF